MDAYHQRDIKKTHFHFVLLLNSLPYTVPPPPLAHIFKVGGAALLSLQAPWQAASSAAVALIVLWVRLFPPASLLLLVMQQHFVMCFAIELCLVMA